MQCKLRISTTAHKAPAKKQVPQSILGAANLEHVLLTKNKKAKKQTKTNQTKTKKLFLSHFVTYQKRVFCGAVVFHESA